MKILVIGGNRFVGRHFVDTALARGHTVTTFTRGKTNPGLFGEAVEALTGDRNADLDVLAGRSWDAVIDTCGYVPREVRTMTAALRDCVAHYVFISSISVYRDFTVHGIDEDYPVGTLDDPRVEDVTNETYGPLKALCEQAAADAFGDAALNVRPGLIVGPYDPTERFTYWVRRAARGGEIAAPGRPGRHMQVIDGRDLAEWLVHAVESRLGGTFNTVSPPWEYGEVIEACIAAAGSDARVEWIDEDLLVANDFSFPAWAPESDSQWRGTEDVDASRARASGLRARSVRETVQATLDWVRAENPPPNPKLGPTPEREAELLAAWRAR